MLWFGRGFRRRCRTITHNCLASFADAISTRLLDAPSFPPVKAYRRIPHAPRLLDAAHVVVLFLSVDVAWVLINRFSSSQAAGMPTSPAAVRSSRFCFPSVGVHSRWSTLRHARRNTTTNETTRVHSSKSLRQDSRAILVGPARFVAKQHTLRHIDTRTLPRDQRLLRPSRSAHAVSLSPSRMPFLTCDSRLDNSIAPPLTAHSRDSRERGGSRIRGREKRAGDEPRIVRLVL